MKILLIDLGSNRTELNEPIGIESIAGSLMEIDKKIKIKMIWALLDSDSIKDIDTDFDIIGISAKLGTLQKLDFLLSNLLEERKKNKVIIGGPLSTFGYKELLTKYKDIICLRGEGETSFKLLVERFIQYGGKINYQNVPNLAFIKNNKIYESERIVEDLNKLSKPYRYYLDKILNKEGIIRIENSRGCSWSNCEFCSVSEHYGCKKWRPFPISYILEELKFLSDRGCKSPYFTDEDFFGSNYERSKELANRIITAKNSSFINPDMNFFFSARINDILHSGGYELLQLWKKAGLREIFIGLESGVKKQLKRYGKAATPKRNAKVINIIRELDIQLDTGYILFDPEMSFEELIEDISYIENENLSRHDSRSLKKIRAQPLTGLTEKYFKKSIINGSLNLDLLYYPLKYQDEQVYKVLKLFEDWENKLSSEVYMIQSLSRGEISSEKYRVYLKEQLSQIRELDFFILKEIVRYIKGEISKINLMNTQNEKYKEKRQIIKSSR